MTNQQVKPKVLVADDERVIADTLAIILNQSGFEATAVYNGEKAVEAARTLRPDMLISDVIMTDMNGIDAAITIRSMLPNCKILLFSGQAATADLLDRARSRDTNSRFWPNPYTRRICWRVCAVRSAGSCACSLPCLLREGWRVCLQDGGDAAWPKSTW